jgi:hypothetical protein
MNESLILALTVAIFCLFYFRPHVAIRIGLTFLRGVVELLLAPTNMSAEILGVLANEVFTPIVANMRAFTAKLTGASRPDSYPKADEVEIIPGVYVQTPAHDCKKAGCRVGKAVLSA